MSRNETKTPINIVKNVDRKSHAETLLRILIASSYPHSLFPHLVINLMEKYGCDDQDKLNEYAETVRHHEQSLGVFDFIRCIEIIKDHGTIRMEAKRHETTNETRSVVDNINNQVTVANITFDTVGLTLSEDDAREIGAFLLTAYYKISAIGSNKQKEPSSVGWLVRERQNKAKRATGEYYKRTDVTYQEAAEILFDALRTPKYHLILSRNSVGIRNKSIRLSIQDSRK